MGELYDWSLMHALKKFQRFSIMRGFCTPVSDCMPPHVHSTTLACTEPQIALHPVVRYILRVLYSHA